MTHVNNEINFNDPVNKEIIKATISDIFSAGCFNYLLFSEWYYMVLLANFNKHKTRQLTSCNPLLQSSCKAEVTHINQKIDLINHEKKLLKAVKDAVKAVLWWVDW